MRSRRPPWHPPERLDWKSVFALTLLCGGLVALAFLTTWYFY